MKFLKGIGGALCFIGCLAALMGILATAAPMMDNDQVRRILESFSVPTRDVVLQAINNFFLLCLQQNYWVFGAGIGVLLLGGLIRMYAERSLLADVVADDRVTEPRSRAARMQPTRVSATTAPRAATANPVVPTPPQKPVELSPYAAAAYGNALAGHAYGSGSAIADKYMPRSIINTPEAEDTTAAYRPVDVADPFPAASGVATELPTAFSQTAAQPWGTPATAAEPVHLSESPRKTGFSTDAMQSKAPNVNQTDAERVCPDCGATCDAESLYCPTCGCRLAKPTAENLSPKQKSADAVVPLPFTAPIATDPLSAPPPQKPVSAPAAQRVSASAFSSPEATSSTAFSASPALPAQPPAMPADSLSRSPFLSDSPYYASPYPTPTSAAVADSSTVMQSPQPNPAKSQFSTVNEALQPTHARIVSTVRPSVSNPETNAEQNVAPQAAAEPITLAWENQTSGQEQAAANSNTMPSTPANPEPNPAWSSAGAPSTADWQWAEPVSESYAPDRYAPPAGASAIPVNAGEFLPVSGFPMQKDSPATVVPPSQAPAAPSGSPTAPRPRIVSTMRKKNS